MHKIIRTVGASEQAPVRPGPSQAGEAPCAQDIRTVVVHLREAGKDPGRQARTQAGRPGPSQAGQAPCAQDNNNSSRMVGPSPWHGVAWTTRGLATTGSIHHGGTYILHTDVYANLVSRGAPSTHPPNRSMGAPTKSKDHSGHAWHTAGGDGGRGYHAHEREGCRAHVRVAGRSIVLT